MLKLLTLLIFLFCSFVATANSTLLPLTMQQGLTHNGVRAIHLDRFGFLWIATAGGINRFDGTQVTELHGKNISLSEMSFSHILEDSQGRIWLSAEHTGLFLYDRESGKFEFFVTAPRAEAHPEEATILSLIEQDSEHLLFVVNQRIFQLRIADKQLTTLFDLADLGYPNGWIRDLLLNEQQLIIAAFNGVIQLDLSTGNHRYLTHLSADIAMPTADQLHSKVLHLDEQSLWVGTVDGLYQLARAQLALTSPPDPKQNKTWLAGQNIWRLATVENHLYISTNQGLFQLTAGQAAIRSVLSLHESSQSVADSSIVDFAIDAQQGVWLANRASGVYYWHPRFQAFADFNRQQQMLLSHKSIHDLQLIDEQLWLATENGLNLFDLSTQQSQAFLVNPDPTRTLVFGQIKRLAPLADDLWLETAEGIQRFNLTEQRLVAIDAPDITPFLRGARSLFVSGNSLFFLKDKRAYHYTPATGTLNELNTLNDQVPMEYFGQFLGNLPDQSLLFSSYDQLWRYWPDSDQLALVYQVPDYMPELIRYANLMYLDQQGLVWLAFRGLGLLAFDSEQLTLQQHLTADNGLLSNEVLSLLQDQFGDLWLTSRNSLARIDPRTLQVEYFTTADGLPFTDFNPVAALPLSGEQLLFASKNGLLQVNPSYLQQMPSVPQVVITELSIFNQQPREIRGYLNQRQFELTAEDKALRIHFSAMNFQQNHKMTYRFWFNNDLENAVEQQDNQLFLPQLAPGQYQFNVVALSPYNQLQSAPASITLLVKASWWRSQAAYLLYSMVTLLLLLMFFARRNKQQQILKQAHQQVLASEQRLAQALLSVNSGAFEWNADSNCIESERLPKMLGEPEVLLNVTWQQHCSLIHPDDLAHYQQAWQKLLQSPDTMLDITYRLKHRDGRWLWFRDRGRVTDLASTGAAKKVVGTFNNITETKANAEKARLFGEAFQQTRDWVVILDTRQRVLAANQSFCQAFGAIDQYVDSPRVHHLGISLVRRRFYTKLLKGMSPGEHWQGEEQVITPDGRERPTLINVSAVGDRNLQFYVLVFTDITAQKAAEEELRYLANYDTLTGLPNRALLMDRINHGIEKAKRDKRALALCFIDLDKFKNINDSLGHDIGDLMLKEVARRLKLTLRDSDTVARLGGDEFVVLLEDYKTNDNISHVARKMLSTISEPMVLLTETVAVSPSIGIALYPDDALTSTELMKHADVAMYHAKEAGRNNFQFFIKEMNEKAHMQLARETRLRRGIQANELLNYYQPIIDSREDCVVGVEVLLRWQTAEGMISPAEFIPLAEEMRLIVGMTQQLLERALADVKNWWAAGYRLYLSVNLTTQHLEQAALAETVIALLKRYQLPAAALRFEITESALMRDQQGAIRTMHALSDAGIKLALDDFGTGYSSLKYLKELPLDAIKIDRSFVQDIGIDHNDETIIDAMLSMAASLGLYCVAEGVETEQQLAFFNQRHCYLIQGFLFSKPLPAADILALLASNRFAKAETDEYGLWQI